jgi:hypothetical protein
MSAARSSTRAELKAARYVGTAVTAVLALLPYVSDFFVTAFVVGALSAVWFAVRKDRHRLSFGDGAELGFHGGFYGLVLASGVYDVVWKFFHYELWRINNADRILSIFAGAVRDAFDPSLWWVMIFQIVMSAILAGSVGAPAGILGVRIFQRDLAH